MRFSLKFIQEFLKVGVSPQKLAERLTMAGMEVESLEEVRDDWIFDIEVTTNRYDWLSILGITREIAAVLGKDLRIKYPQIRKETTYNERKILIKDSKDCPYYVGRLIKGVKPKISPPELKEMIVNCGVSLVNNIVDATNYAMLKWGNPLHAFDNDKIEGNIYIRRAKKGESFVGIDEKERVLGKDNLVIADDKKIIALAGVIGAKNTEVDQNTRNVFLEAAIFSPITVRRSRRIAGLDTESSYRFERTVSSDHLEYASYEAAKVIEDLAQGKISGCQRVGRKPKVLQNQVIIDLRKLNFYLGTTFTKSNVEKILKSLGFNAERGKADKLKVMPPLDRSDIKGEVDVYEEFSRIYGYDKIEAKVPSLSGYSQKKLLAAYDEDIYCFKEKLADFISLLNFREIVTYSLEDSEESLKNEAIKVINPLRKQEGVLRTSLLGGMIKAIRHNLNRNQSSLVFFEVAHTYRKEGKGFLETPTLSLGLSQAKGGFFHLKGVVEAILRHLNIEQYNFKEDSLKDFTNSLFLLIDKKNVGFLGKLDNAARKKADLKQNLFFAQLDLSLLSKAKNDKKYKPPSLYPAIARDISILLKKGIKFNEVEKIIKGNGGYLKELSIIDFYQGKDILDGAQAFTLRIFYQSQNRTLTSKEIDSTHSEIREKLSQTQGITLR